MSAVKLSRSILLCSFCACFGAFAEAPASRGLKDCTVEVRVTGADGNPVQGALVFLTSPHDDGQIILANPQGGESASIYNITVQNNMGLYVFHALAPGHKVVEFPIIADNKKKEKKVPDIILQKTDAASDAAISPDKKICRWESIWQGYVRRKRQSTASFQRAYMQAPAFKLNNVVVLDADYHQNNWGEELFGLSKEMSGEKDKDTKAFLSICYLDLGLGSIAMQPAAIDYALRSLSPISPFWSLSPQMPYQAIMLAGGMRSQGVMMYLGEMEKKHVDPEVRAYAILRRVEYYDARGSAADRKKLGRSLAENYPETSAAKIAKARFPYDFE